MLIVYFSTPKVLGIILTYRYSFTFLSEKVCISVCLTLLVIYKKHFTISLKCNILYLKSVESEEM